MQVITKTMSPELRKKNIICYEIEIEKKLEEHFDLTHYINKTCNI